MKKYLVSGNPVKFLPTGKMAYYFAGNTIYEVEVNEYIQNDNADDFGWDVVCRMPDGEEMRNWAHTVSDDLDDIVDNRRR